MFSKTLKVLYVEDNKEARESTLLMLKNFFNDIEVAVDGKDGLEKFQQNDFHLVISDINMPNKNGIDMIRDIKKQNDEVFCFIISAHNESNYFTDAIELGVDGFLLKPIKFDQFATLMIKTIKRIQNSQETKKLNEKQAKLSSLGEMMDAIAHQWKQPLGTISMISSSVAYKLENNIDISNDEILSNNLKILKQTDHAIETLNCFRDFFRPDEIQKEVLAKDLIGSVANLMKSVLLKENIKLNLSCDETIKIDVIENEFKHVFINLINNSKDAYLTFDKGVQKVINIDILNNNDNKVIIDFKDNAGGIPNSIIDNIFQSNFTTKNNSKGTGVGLYMTKQIIEKVGGSIEVYNCNDGACFRILI
ncbi:MAG: response regulator [Campylobacterota bacterium]|nr:response regulator [Campylobacterota bacterium]